MAEYAPEMVGKKMLVRNIGAVGVVASLWAFCLGDQGLSPDPSTN